MARAHSGTDERDPWTQHEHAYVRDHGIFVAAIGMGHATSPEVQQRSARTVISNLKVPHGLRFLGASVHEKYPYGPRLDPRAANLNVRDHIML